MASADEVRDWQEAVQAFETGHYEEAILKLSGLNPTAKIMFNIGCCFLCLEDYTHALQKLNHALSMDSHLAIAYYLQGEINYVEKRYGAALKSYEKAHEKLRGKTFIDYRPIGLKHVMYEWQVIANEVVLSSQLNHGHSGIINLNDQSLQSYVQVVLQSIKENKTTDIVKFLPVVLFQPPKGSVQNVDKKDFLGKAKVVSTVNEDDIYSCFSGTKMVENSAPVPIKTPPNRPMPPRPIQVSRTPPTHPAPMSRTPPINRPISMSSKPPRRLTPNTPPKPRRISSPPTQNRKYPLKATTSTREDISKNALDSSPVKMPRPNLTKATSMNHKDEIPRAKPFTPSRISSASGKPAPPQKPGGVKKTTTDKPRAFSQNNDGKLAITTLLNKELLMKSPSMSTPANYSINGKLEKRQSIPINSQFPPQKSLPTLLKKERPTIPPSPKLLAKPKTPSQQQRTPPSTAHKPSQRMQTSPVVKPKRPPKPTVVTPRQVESDDEHIYETVSDMNVNKSASLSRSRSFPLKLNQQQQQQVSDDDDDESVRLEKTMYGNIFCQAPVTHHHPPPPTKPLPVLRR